MTSYRASEHAPNDEIMTATSNKQQIMISSQRPRKFLEVEWNVHERL